MGAVRIVEMLFCTSLLVVVGAGDTPELSPRRLKVLNTSNHTCIADLTFVTSILAVRLNRARLVVVEERRAVVHELSTLCVQRTIDTVQNPRGVCALSADDDSSLLALPAHAHAGSVVVHDCVNLHVVCELTCHNSPVAAMALTRDGAMLATASAKGTVIRVHCLPRGDKVWSFRRGVVNAKVRTLAFGGEASTTGEASDDSGEPGAKLLAASSEKGTVHVWRIEGPPRDKSETDIDHEERAFDEEPHHPRECDASHGVLSGVLKGGTKLVGGLLPSGLTRRVHDTWQPARERRFDSRPRHRRSRVRRVHRDERGGWHWKFPIQAQPGVAGDRGCVRPARRFKSHRGSRRRGERRRFDVRVRRGLRHRACGADAGVLGG